MYVYMHICIYARVYTHAHISNGNNSISDDNNIDGYCPRYYRYYHFYHYHYHDHDYGYYYS